ncbi:MAG: hypothetical protein JWL69_2987 [Phycisphaerales bacterium]|jgi:Uma2 family endonuclease|nr:hypothetical protein [Phycisphaerales bacterium]MDB5355039.1 hypothetical protein [Phycisphaerales bacterium]
MTQATTHRQFEPGTTGWMVDDLQDPDVQWRWSEGRYELVDGVLTKMAPQGIQGIRPLVRLQSLIQRHLDDTQQRGAFYHEVDILLSRGRVPRPDLAFLSAEQDARQVQIEQEKGISEADYAPIFIPPILVVESVSAGHEDHDRVTKRNWYAAFGIPHYWLLTAHERSLVCLILDGGNYIEESSGNGDATLRTSALGGMAISLGGLWRG